MSPDHLLIATLYGVYLVGCIHWIAPSQIALVEGTAIGWAQMKVSGSSYTLLNRMPLIRNPLSTRPGLAILDEIKAAAIKMGRGEAEGEKLIIEALTRGLRRRTQILTIVGSLSGANLLIALPAIIQLGWLAAFWRPILIGIVALHLLVVCEFFICTRRWRRTDSGTFYPALISICLNPLSAVRSADLISNWMIGRRALILLRNVDRG